MTTIEKLYAGWRALQPLQPEVQRRLDQQFMIDFNYNTNHLEGNTLTYGQTKLLFLFGQTTDHAKMRDYEEMKAHAVGLEWMKKEAMDKERANCTVRELSDKLGINKSAVQKHLDFLKKHDYIIRQGGTKGKWMVNLENGAL
jgi:DNA-binding MarR family transcriptional regulator